MSGRGKILREIQRDAQRHKRHMHRLEKAAHKIGAIGKQFGDVIQREIRPEPQPLCGATTRAGGSCRMKCVPGRSRCYLHGGSSTGPKTAAGKAAIAASNKRRAEARRAGAVSLVERTGNR